jgi:folate-binding Fe-S cluster repair protein YgfZ
MLNYELLGAVSFTKGCYPGQENVARTQYRGEIKRRTWLLHGDRPDVPAPGQAIFGAQSEQAAGTVLAAAPARQGGFDALACMHTELAAAGELRLGAQPGAALTRLALPYALPATR